MWAAFSGHNKIEVLKYIPLQMLFFLSISVHFSTIGIVPLEHSLVLIGITM